MYPEEVEEKGDERGGKEGEWGEQIGKERGEGGSKKRRVVVKGKVRRGEENKKPALCTTQRHHKGAFMPRARMHANLVRVCGGVRRTALRLTHDHDKGKGGKRR